MAKGYWLVKIADISFRADSVSGLPINKKAHFEAKTLPSLLKINKVVIGKKENKVLSAFPKETFYAVTLTYFDENGKPTITFTAKKGKPKPKPTSVKSDANDVAIETIELAHEGLNIVEN